MQSLVSPSVARARLHPVIRSLTPERSLGVNERELSGVRAERGFPFQRDVRRRRISASDEPAEGSSRLTRVVRPLPLVLGFPEISYNFAILVELYNVYR